MCGENNKKPSIQGLSHFVDSLIFLQTKTLINHIYSKCYT